jgi:hypothetical protein
MAVLQLNEVSGDFLESFERLDDLNVTGVAVGFPDNTGISLTLNDKTYNGNIFSEKFSILISGDDIMDLVDNQRYNIEVTATLDGVSYTDSEDVGTGTFDSAIHQIHATNVIQTPNLRFTSDLEINSIKGRIKTLEDTIMKSPVVPVSNVDEGDLWLDTTTSEIKFYKEIEDGVFDWVPLQFSLNDRIDGGTY